MLDENGGGAFEQQLDAPGSLSGKNFGKSSTADNYNLSDRMVKPLNDWVYQTAAMAELCGYRPIPYYKSIGKPSPYAAGQRYTADDPKWATADFVAIALDNVVLVDWDAYKDQVISIAELAVKLGITEGELRGAEVQNDPKKDSKHFFFRLPDGFDSSQIMDSNNGNFIRGIDFKTGNQLAYLKPHKELRNDILPFTNELPLVPQIIIDEILKPKTVATQIGEVKTCTKENQHALLHLDDACNALAAMGPDTGRNSKLNELSLEFLSLAHGGFLHVETVRNSLLEAYMQCGGEGFEATFNSANRKAATQPRNTVKPHVGAVAFGDGAIPQQHNSPTLPNVDCEFNLFEISANWVEEWVMTPEGQYQHKALKNVLTQRSFDNRFHNVVPNGEGNASKYVKGKIPTVDCIFYNPLESRDVYRDKQTGLIALNTYVHYSPERVDTKRAGELIKKHLKWVFGDEETEMLILDWMAWQVQKIGVLNRFAPVVVGDFGDGKTTIANFIKNAIGKANVAQITNDAIQERFNGWANEGAVGVIEELYVSGKDRYTIGNRLKPVITNEDFRLTVKYMNGVTVDNYTNYFVCTNHRDCIPLEKNDRRWWVIESQWLNKPVCKAQSKIHHEEVYHYLKHEDNGGVHWFLKDHVISDKFLSFSEAPMTPAKMRMMQSALPENTLAITERLGSLGQLLVINGHLSTTELLRRDIDSGYQYRLSGGKSLSKALDDLGFKRVESRPTVNGIKHTLYCFPIGKTINDFI
ncbi:primase-helicase family protein [Vibrio sp.]|uniref:primase-helicase family protein n=1 Tax=Vibrio sp. TaxID=678 RepID=UPI003AA86082